MIRTVLITEAVNEEGTEKKILYGRFDIVALTNQGFHVVKSYKKRFSMSDETFALNGKPIEE